MRSGMRSGSINEVLAALLVVAVGTGCASDQATINRVQNEGAIKKSMLTEGEWYTHTTVIDTDYGSATFVGDGDELSRVRFEVQKELLLVRRVDEWIRDSEGDHGTAGQTEKTAVVAMYKILDHFDVKRDYNAVTGEEQNVVVENDTDRPWDLRAYMRVDWSQNLINDVNFGVTGGMGGIKLTAVPFWDQGASKDAHPDYAPRFDRDADGDLAYFDIVNRYFSEPTSMTFANGDGTTTSVPTCLFIMDMHKDCAPGHIWARRSFMKVVDRDYQPEVYTTDRMDRAGFFLNSRDGYDRDYGLARSDRARFVQRHNIWEQSHFRRKDDKLVGCNTDSHCRIEEGGETPPAGSVCDHAFGSAWSTYGACTLPYRERTIRHIPYYVSERFPEELLHDAFNLIKQWDAPFRATVRSLRRIECENAGGKDCGKYAPEREGYEAKDEERVLVPCHNPVKEWDHAACGEPGTVARIGDIRYNILVWVDEPQTSSPLGFGPSYTDPFTGEIINVGAYIYGAPLDIYASQARDILALIRGDLRSEEIQDDYAYEAWINELRAREERESSAEREADFHVIALDGDDAHQAAQSMDFSWLKSRLDRRLGPGGVKGAKNLGAALEVVSKALGQVGADMALDRKGRGAIASLAGTRIEQLMLDDEVYAQAGLAPPSLVPGQKLSTDQIEQFSPLRGRSIEGLAARRDMKRMLSLGRRHCMLEQDFVDDGLAGLVRAIDRAIDEGREFHWYGRSYPVEDRGKIDYTLVREMLRHPIFHAVAQHEVGHTLGLRHNFSGSYDAVNYLPEYWELRNDGKMQPRAWDPMKGKEIGRRIREYQYSTVMDYGHNFAVTDANGIGHYDTAAIKLGYGDLVEVFEKVPAANRERVAELAVTASYGLLSNIDVDSSGRWRLIPYTEWPKLVGGVKNLEARRDVAYTSLESVRSSSFGGRLPARTASGEPAVPYRYCGDEFADFSPDCLRYDAGADPYETIQSIVDAYWEYYPFSHFMRERLGFDVNAVAGRTYERFFTKLEDANRIYSFYRGLFDSVTEGTPDGDTFNERADGLGAFSLGVRAGFDLMRQVIATPEPDTYAVGDRGDGTTALLGNAFQGQEIDSFNGRFLRTGFDFGPDFSWIFLNRAGFFHDKSLAVELLTEARATFVAQDTTADVREFSTSFYTTFPDETTELFRGLISNSWASFAPRLTDKGLRYPRFEQVLNGGAGMAGTIVDPNFAFSLQMVAMVYANAYIPASFDQNFINKARLFVKGGVEAVELTVPLVEWTDPKSGLTYQAGSYLDADGVERGVGASMLLWAQALEASGATDELADWVDNLDIMRWITTQLGGGLQVR